MTGSASSRANTASHRPAIGPRNLRDALAEAIICLEAASVSSGPLAAELLVMHVLGCDRTWLYAHADHILSAGQQTAFDRLIEQRATGVPVQYLVGHQEFWGLDFEVNPSVLIPRPETEHVVEVALARLGNRRSQPLRIADFGTGSGCIAVALARELPKANILATDISQDALAVAHRNASRHGVTDRIEFRRSNLLGGDRQISAADKESFGGNRKAPFAGAGRAPFGGADTAPFDLIVSNPPYVALRDASKLAREVREHEPHQALFAGEDGLAFYQPLVSRSRLLLAAGGLLVVELGFDCASAVRRLLDNRAWCAMAIERDLAGIDRVISAERAV